MATALDRKEHVIRAIQDLTADKLEQVIDFIDFLQARNRSSASTIDEPSLILQQSALAKIWGSEEDLYEL
jgi:hypothetical protein